MVNRNLAYKLNDASGEELVVNEAPLKWCSVTLSDVVSRGKRLEASVFDVEAKQARQIIYNGKYEESLDWVVEALKYTPENERLINNKIIIENKIKENNN